MTSEVIKHAAVRSKSGMIFLGKSHADCFYQASNVGVRMSSLADDQGFFTNQGRFVNRKLAAAIAYEAVQVEKPLGILFSEDLWSKTHQGKFQYDSIKGYY